MTKLFRKGIICTVWKEVTSALLQEAGPAVSRAVNIGVVGGLSSSPRCNFRLDQAVPLCLVGTLRDAHHAGRLPKVVYGILLIRRFGPSRAAPTRAFLFLENF